MRQIDLKAMQSENCAKFQTMQSVKTMQKAKLCTVLYL